MAARIVATQNYLVPANGKTGAYIWQETLVAGIDYTIDFRDVNLDGQEFWPYGVYINNYYGTAICEIHFDQLGITHLTGQGMGNAQAYPGVVDQSVTIRGEGPVYLVFVNYPIV